MSGYQQAENIIAFVAREYGLSRSDLLGRRRWKTVADARIIAYALIRRLTDLSYPEIARLFRRGCHTTVLKGVQSVRPSDLHEMERRMGAA